jgi:hypothetical protein
MTKVLWVLGIIAVLFGVYKIWDLWDSYDKEKDLQAIEAAKKEVKPDMLAGLPNNVPGIRESLAAAQKEGAASFRNWLKIYGPHIEDPRKAWIELDYMVMIANDDPAEAKKIFAMVESRVGTNSPVYDRVKQLKPSYGR